MNKKEGYLQKQVNSILDVWSTRFFVFDGYSLAYYLDASSLKPKRILSLSDCAIDGLWIKNDMFIFTLKYLNRDSDVILLGSYSEREAQEWIRKLKRSIKNQSDLSILEEFKYEQVVREIDEEKEDKHLDFWNDLKMMSNQTKCLSAGKFEKLFYETLSIMKETSSFWQTQIKKNNMLIFERTEDRFYYFKTELVINCSIIAIIQLMLNDLHMKFWHDYLENIESIGVIHNQAAVYDAIFRYPIHDFVKLPIYYRYRKFTLVEENTFYSISSSVLLNNDSTLRKFFNLNCDIFSFSVEKQNKNTCMIIVGKQKRATFRAHDLIMRKFLHHFIGSFSTLVSEACIISKKLMALQNIKLAPVDQTQPRIMFFQRQQDKQEIDECPELNLEFPQNVQTKRNRVSLLSPEHLTIFQTFKKSLNAKFTLPKSIDDNVIARFIKATGYNLSESLKNFEKFLQWKKENGIDHLKEEDVQEITKTRAAVIITADREGRPILYIKASRLNLSDYPSIMIIKYLTRLVEEMIKRTPPHLDNYIIIGDLENISMKSWSVSNTKPILPVLNNYYPEVLYRLILINGNFLFKSLWYAMKRFIHPLTLEKVALLGTNTEEIHSKLLEYVDDDKIPVAFGGKGNIDIQ